MPGAGKELLTREKFDGPGHSTARQNSRSDSRIKGLHALICWPILRKFSGVRQQAGLRDALVAQLDRALDYESRGREFESSRARHC